MIQTSEIERMCDDVESLRRVLHAAATGTSDGIIAVDLVKRLATDMRTLLLERGEHILVCDEDGTPISATIIEERVRQALAATRHERLNDATNN